MCSPMQDCRGKAGDSGSGLQADEVDHVATNERGILVACFLVNRMAESRARPGIDRTRFSSAAEFSFLNTGV